MPRLIITNGRVIDPAQKLDRVTNLLIEDGQITAYDVPPRGDERVIDATNKIVAPGLIDLQTQLREPGLEEDETIESGTAAALSGGFTSICSSPETDPPVDTPAGVEFVRQKAMRAGNCNVFPIACVSRNREGEQLAEIGSLVEAGAWGFSDGTRAIGNSDLMRRALEYCAMFGRPILHHPEVAELSRGGIMHEGRVSLVLGLGGMPSEAEDVMVGRDCRLLESTRGRLHLVSISSIGSLEVLRRVRARGVPITAGVSVWNLAFNDGSLRTFDPNFKVNPPLRSARHVEACQAALAEGTLDVISSGHSPRASEKKVQEIDHAPFGMSTIETALSQVIEHLIRPGILSWSEALAKLTINPARIMNLPKGTLAVGADADVIVIDPELRWIVTPGELRSHSANTPLVDAELIGRATHVIVGGEVKIER